MVVAERAVVDDGDGSVVSPRLVVEILARLALALDGKSLAGIRRVWDNEIVRSENVLEGVVDMRLPVGV
jgi:hypothetical protein